jgi:Protein of unknown function (DUF3307)
MIMNTTCFLLLLSLGVCHWLADYVFTTGKMLAAKSKGTPLYPIFDHALNHACLMFLVLWAFNTKADLLIATGILQLGSHTAIDTLKGRLNVWFPSVANPMNKCHWVIFGLDQLLHFVVIVLMVWMVSKP